MHRAEIQEGHPTLQGNLKLAGFLVCDVLLLEVVSMTAGSTSQSKHSLTRCRLEAGLLADLELSNDCLPKMRPGKPPKSLVLSAMNPQARNLHIEASVTLPFHLLISAISRWANLAGLFSFRTPSMKLGTEGSLPMDSVASLSKKALLPAP
jgi:hypothetical protein